MCGEQDAFAFFLCQSFQEQAEFVAVGQVQKSGWFVKQDDGGILCASKASNIGEVCQFAAAGKETSKKSLSEIAMSYGYVYVAQIALGANPAQAVKAITEAEAYPGPSLIIGYAPCELHGIAKGGMNHCQDEMKKAVKAGYWNLFSFNPALKAEGKNPFTLTSKAGDGSYQEFLNNEARYTRLIKPFPERAEKLFAKSEETAKARYTHLEKLVKLYGED